MRRALAVTGMLLLGCSAMHSCSVSREGVIIEITAEQIQEKLDAKFPISKRYLIVLNLTLADPEVALREGSERIEFGVSAITNVRVERQDLKGRAHITAAIRYDPKEGALFLVDPQAEDLTISLLPEKYEGDIIEAANLAARELLKDYEVYRLDPSDFKQALAKLVLKDVVVRKSVVRITLGLPE
jgi:hypothetical protein